MTSSTIHFLDELVADFILRHMAKIAKVTLPHIDNIVNLYQKYENVLFGHSPPTQNSSLMKVNNQPVFSPSPVNTRRSAFSSPEILYQGSSTLLKRNPSTSSLQRRHSPFESVNKEESQNVTASPEKQRFPEKLRNTSGHEIENPNDLPVDNTEDEEIQIRRTSRIPITKDKQRLPPKMRMKQNESGSSVEIGRVLSNSDQDSELNINPDQGNDVIEIFEEKRKLPTTKRDAMLFKYIPSYRTSSRGKEIGYDAIWESEENPSSESIFSPTNYKSSRTKLNRNNRKRSPKGMFFSVDESKPGSSRDFRPSVNSTLRISATEAKTKNLYRYDIINFIIDRMYCESSKGSHSVQTASCPKINNLEPQTIANLITQFSRKRQMRDKYMHQFFASLSVFGKDLKYLYCFLVNIQDVVQFFILKKDFFSEEFKKTIVTLTTLCSNLLGKVSLFKMDIDLEYGNWVKYDKEIQKLREKYDPLFHNEQPIATIEVLRVYEEHLKTIWEKIDETILNADSRRSLFLTTAVDLEKLINLFVKFLITIGLLKQSPITL